MGSHYLCGRTALGDFTPEFITKKWESVVWQENKGEIWWDVLPQNDAGFRTQEINYSGKHNSTDRCRMHYPGLKNRSYRGYWLLERNWRREERAIRIRKTAEENMELIFPTRRTRGNTESLLQKKKAVEVFSGSELQAKKTEAFVESVWAMLCFTKAVQLLQVLYLTELIWGWEYVSEIRIKQNLVLKLNMTLNCTNIWTYNTLCWQCCITRNACVIVMIHKHSGTWRMCFKLTFVAICQASGV